MICKGRRLTGFRRRQHSASHQCVHANDLHEDGPEICAVLNACFVENTTEILTSPRSVETASGPSASRTVCEHQSTGELFRPKASTTSPSPRRRRWMSPLWGRDATTWSRPPSCRARVWGRLAHCDFPKNISCQFHRIWRRREVWSSVEQQQKIWFWGPCIHITDK